MPNTNLISEYPPTITENIPHLEPPNGAWAEPELFNRSIIQKLQDYGLGNSDCHSVKDSAILFCLMSGRDMMDWEKMEKAIVLVRSNARLHRHLVDVKAKGGYALMRKVMGIRGIARDLPGLVGQHTSPPPYAQEFHERISAFLAQQSEVFETYATPQIDQILLLWSPPPSLEDEARRKLIELRVPTRVGSNEPDLLLYKLGHLETDDPNMLSKIYKLFHGNQHKVLVNTQGSGKTRLLLEGLSNNWGFYFSYGDLSPVYGSSDLTNTIFRAGGLSDDKIQQRCLSALNARLRIFEAFLDATQSIDSSERRRRWVLFQLQHERTNDIFEGLTEGLLPFDPVDYLAQEINHSTHRIYHALSFHPSYRLSIVLDSLSHPPSVSSRRQNTTNNEIGRRIVSQFAELRLPLNIIVSGTSQSLYTQLMDDYFEESRPWSMEFLTPFVAVSDTGFIKTQDDVRRYVEDFFPDVGQIEDGKEMIRDLWALLAGRYQYTAEVVSLMLQYGVKHWRSILSCYWFHHTGIKLDDVTENGDVNLPEGCEEKIKSPPSILSRFDLLDDRTTDLLLSILLRFALTGKHALITDISFPSAQALVELGLARNAANGEIVMDEMIVICAGAKFIESVYEDEVLGESMKNVVT